MTASLTSIAQYGITSFLFTQYKYLLIKELNTE